VAPRRAFVERRKNERVPLAVPVFVRGRDSEGKEFLEFATALNVSAGGALLATRRFLAPFSAIGLEVPSAPLPRTRALPRAVRRLRARLLRVAVVDGYQLWGLKFSSPLVSKGKGWKVHSVR
jgi:hypothetical protein